MEKEIELLKDILETEAYEIGLEKECSEDWEKEHMPSLRAEAIACVRTLLDDIWENGRMTDRSTLALGEFYKEAKLWDEEYEYCLFEDE